MNRPHPKQNLRRCTGGHTDRGSAIILVLVSMVLMAILAGSLLQLTRFERIPRSESNIDVVVASVVEAILNAATDDLLDDNGHFLNAGDAGTGGGDESSDFPWTNTAVTTARQAELDNGNPINVDGGWMDDSWLAAQIPDFGPAPAAGTAYHGTGSTGANLTDANNGVWRKITCLTGLFLRGADGTSNLASGAAVGNEDAVTFTSNNTTDMNINTTSALLVDADGDGIGDSRWEWAPLRQVGATKYVMAVRIVDLSARMNINVAMGSTNASGTFSSATDLSTVGPRGDGPGELDGPGFVSLFADAAGISIANAHANWRQAVDYRYNGDTDETDSPATNGIAYDGNTVGATAASRYDYWDRAASRVPNTFDTYNGAAGTAAFGFLDAYELLQGNGLNTTATENIETLMAQLLRSGGQEGTFAGITGTATNADINNHSWTRRQFMEIDARKHMTVFSGSSIAVKPFQLAQDRELKIDVNEAIKTANTRVVLRNRIESVLTNTNSGPLLNEYPHIDSTTNTIRQMANQITVNLADYIDRDNAVTIIGSGENGATGFEALPYITEVYTERVYEGTVTVNAGDPAMSTIAWTAAPGGTANELGYIIEVGNPFGQFVGGNWVGRPVSLDNVWLGIDGTVMADDLRTLTGQEYLLPGQVVHLYRDSTGNTNDASPDVTTLEDYYNNANGNNTDTSDTTKPAPISRLSAATMPAMPTDDTEFTVSLHAAEQGTTTSLGWSYSACLVEVADETLPVETFDATDHDTSANPVYQSYLQTSHRGVGQGLKMMTVGADPAGTNGYHEDISTLASPQANTTLPDPSGPPDVGHARRSLSTWFNNETKDSEPSGFTDLDNKQIVWMDNPRGRMHWIGDLLQIPIIGPDREAAGNATTMAEAFRLAASGGTSLSNTFTGTGVDALLLPYKVQGAGTAAPLIDTSPATTPETDANGFGARRIPHALLLMEQLTTYNPATDGNDGDGQGDSATEGDEDTSTAINDDLLFDENEVLVPGRINLNTASLNTLIAVLPYPDLTTRQQIAAAIIARRENTTQNSGGATNYGLGSNGIPGIAYTPSLFEQIEALTVNPSNPALAGDTTTLGGTRIDLSGLETLPTADATTGPISAPTSEDGIGDDREEEIMLAKWLTEVADTRSDVFAAYIVVQGYPASNFSGGPTESARLIIIFTRANVAGAGDKAVEIGRIRLN